jgi:hypothetical protein
MIDDEDDRPLTDEDAVARLVAAFGPESLDNADDQTDDDQEDA